MASKTLPLLAAFALFSVLAEAQVTVGRSVRQEIRVISQAGDSTVPLSVTQVQTMLPGGKVIDGSIVGLFDPSSRLFWWMHQSSIGLSDPETVLKEFLNSVTFAVYPDQIVCFSAEGRSLEVVTSEMRVSSMDEGVSKAIRLLPEELPEYLSGKTLEYHRVPLAQDFGQAFFNPKDFGDPPVRLKVIAVDRLVSGWRIEIRNGRGESKTVFLSTDFKTATNASQ